MGPVLRRLLLFFQRNQFDRDLQDELRFDEELKAHALADAHGMSGDHLAAYSPIDAGLTGRGEPLQVPALDVSPPFFATLGVTRRSCPTAHSGWKACSRRTSVGSRARSATARASGCGRCFSPRRSR